jgi:malate dehydrogenase (oxaloacetate-decarboxylating)
VGRLRGRKELMVRDLKSEALKLHRDHSGKIAVRSKIELRDTWDLSLAYSPGVAEPCLAIADSPDAVYDYTARGNLVAVVSDGSAVLGLGDIGPRAALPVMEGKSILFKHFAGVDAFPIVLDTHDVDEIVEAVKLMSPTFGGINLEDISAPRCFEIEARLKQAVDIPVFHDDQHGTAVVMFAGLINALKLAGKVLERVKVVINGAGAAGVAIAKLLKSAGATDILVCDRGGIVCEGRAGDTNASKKELARLTNPAGISGTLADAVRGADVFIGVSVGGVLTPDMVRSMASDPLVFALANPDPEILPDEAKAAGARVVATGRSDYPNQVNNVLGFPGIFRGALDVRASDINEEMKIAAARAIAELISGDELSEDYIIPKPFDARVVPNVAAEVARAAIDSGVARVVRDPEDIRLRAREVSSLL